MSDASQPEVGVAIHIAELRGFLNALQRLCEAKSAFFAEVVRLSDDADSTLSKYFAECVAGCRYQGARRIAYSDVEAILDAFVYSKLRGVQADAIATLAWQLIEYYGLASTAADSNGPFKPLVSNGALLLSVSFDLPEICAYFAVEIPGHLIITGLATQRDEAN